MKSQKYLYWELGTRDKKTGKLPKYKVYVQDFKIIDCNCPARSFRSFSPCKHMKRLNEKLGHSL